MIKALVVLFLAFGYIIMSNLPYIPGPEELYVISNRAHDIISLVDLLLLIGLPVGAIWVIVCLIKFHKIGWLPIIIFLSGFIVFCNKWYLEPQFRDHSRDRTIQEAAELLEKIESYRELQGYYPDSLKQLVHGSVNIMPTPSSMGIKEYTYKRVDDVFNYEIIIYNPLGTQKGRGEMPKLYDTGYKNWKYCNFD